MSARSDARAALATSTLSQLLTPVSAPPAHTSLVAPSSSALACRQELRRRRRECADTIWQLLEQQRKEEEERREAQRKADERRDEDRSAQEQRERERKAKEAADAAARRLTAAKAPAPSADCTIAAKRTPTPEPSAKVSQKNDRPTQRDNQAEKAEQVQASKSARARKVASVTASGLQLPLIAPGNSAEVRGTDKIQSPQYLNGDSTPTDVKQVIDLWNEVCDEAEPFRKDPSVKKVRMDIKKQINLMSNQIAASVKHVSQKVVSLSNVLRHSHSVAGNGGEAFTMKQIAMRLVQESDGSVSLNRTAAFAVGAVIVGVTAACRDPKRMRDVFIGAFYKHSIYTIPAYGRRLEGESAEDFRYRIGYKDGETPEGYMERACGCISLFAAVMQTDQVLGQAQSWASTPNPFSLDIGWTWLARIANKEQRSITPAIAFAFLEVAGYSMSLRYRKQFAKLMAMLQKAVILNAAKGAPKGAVSRMGILIEEFIAAGCSFSTPPKDRELPAKDLEFL